MFVGILWDELIIEDPCVVDIGNWVRLIAAGHCCGV